jgi:serine/threonine protein kinase/tetratricopeptide (TPR) repeat protein
MLNDGGFAMEVAAPLSRSNLSPPSVAQPLPNSSVPTVLRPDDLDDVVVGETPSTIMPKVGEKFEGFAIIAELGRGSFGRVFLAHQTDMADRLVALKVTLEFFDESQTLAALQHSNIVPIYSAHGENRLRALCMPYFGATTLADICRGLKTANRLPLSGKHFVNTLEMRRASTRTGESSDNSQSSLGSAPHDQPLPAPLTAEVPGARPTFDLLSGYTFVEAVLWIGARLADGLAHAHERGVIHRDVKPANVLLADDGRPMLLDFNLSADKHRGSPARGGTVPYMAPEQARAHLDGQTETLDGRTDVYALGLVLYELITGRMPYPRHKDLKPETIRQMLAERQGPPPPMSSINPDVTPAVEAIVGKCMAFDRVDRYASALALEEDLERQLAHKPLLHVAEPSIKERVAKWCRRHPKASSLGTLAAGAAVLVGAMGFGLVQYQHKIAQQDAQLARQSAEAKLTAFFADTDQLRHELIRPPEGESRSRTLTAARAALGQYGLPDRADWRNGPLVSTLGPEDAARLTGRLEELLALLTQAELDRVDNKDVTEQANGLMKLSDAAATFAAMNDRPHYWWKQREPILKLAGDVAGAAAAATAANERQPATTFDRYLTGVELYQSGKYAESAKLMEALTTSQPQHFGAWFVLGASQYRLHRDAEAVTSFTTCIALNPKSGTAYYDRGYACYRGGNCSAALRDFRQAQELSDADGEIALKIALCLRALHKDDEAESIYAKLITDENWQLRALVARADSRKHRGDHQGAAADRAAAIKLSAVSALDFNSRGAAHMARKDYDGALADLRRAEELNPGLELALLGQAEILADRLKTPRTQEAIAALERLLARSPDSPKALASRAVYLARLKRTDEALADAQRCLAICNLPFIRYQIAGVYALTSDRPGHAKEALRLLTGAIRQQASLARELAGDPDLKTLRELPEYRTLADAVKSLASMDCLTRQVTCVPCMLTLNALAGMIYDDAGGTAAHVGCVRISAGTNPEGQGCPLMKRDSDAQVESSCFDCSGTPRRSGTIRDSVDGSPNHHEFRAGRYIRGRRRQ